MEWNAQTYQSTCGRVTEHGVKLVDILRKTQSGKVLDLGCGTGVLTNEIAEFSDEVIGIDSSSAMVDKAKSMYPGIKFYVMDACALQWDNYFDAIFSNAVLHFIKTQDILLDSVHKALTNDGVFICEFGASGSIADLLNAVTNACSKRGKSYSLRFYYPTEEEYSILLKRHGFFVESAFSYDLDTQLTESRDSETGSIRFLMSR
jgi:trans-aconitate methyltransferase